MHGTRVTKQNMGTLAGNLNISVEEFDDMMSKSYGEFKRKQDKEWAIEFFHKDEQWYEETNRNFSIPLMTDEKYVNAWCIEMLLTNPDAYLNSQKWN